YSIVSFRQPPVETACRTALRPTSPSVVRAAHLTASFQFVNTHRNRRFPRSLQALFRLPGRASYSLLSIRQHSSKTAVFARSRMR
ncbi:hypothetical protein, partial [Lysobacter enzymogenes]|uniref:hypothetical protein n=2 Tax=Lysobacter enzymogenes TaxID=69 RepID=UPI001B8D700A